jgi:polyisoprenoid-binding protein YceI
MERSTTVLTKTKWAIDPSHSQLTFRVKHLMITYVRGEFTKFSGEVETEENDFSKGSVSVTIDASSIYTNDAKRDMHLKSPDFFDVEQHPQITFQGSSLVKIGQRYQLKGLLTIKGISNEVVLDAEFGGINKDPWGNEKAGFSLTGKINRKDYGLNWNAPLETGGVLVGDEVQISGEIQLVKRP